MPQRHNGKESLVITSEIGIPEHVIKIVFAKFFEWCKTFKKVCAFMCLIMRESLIYPADEFSYKIFVRHVFYDLICIVTLEHGIKIAVHYHALH